MKFIATLAAAAAFAMPAAAFAQDVLVPHDGHDESQAAPVTDAELEQFADIVVQGQGIQNNADMNDQQKQAAILGMIEASDMGLARFSQVAEAIGEDAALQARIQQAVMARMGAEAAAS